MRWPRGNDDEIRHVNTVIMQNFFRDALVFAENKTGRAATGEGHALHFEEGNDVLIEAAVILELIGQIENHVRLEGCQLLPQQIEIIKNGEMFCGVAEGSQRAQDVGLGFPILRLHFLAQVLIDRGRPDGVEQGEDL